MNGIDFSRLWVATKHVKGAWGQEPFVEFMKRNNRDLLEHRPPDRTLGHVCPTLEEALKYNREMKRRTYREVASDEGEEPRASAGEAREGNRTDVVGTDGTDLTEVKKNDI